MSRIGKAPITLPKGVSLTQADGSVAAKGPKGELRQAIPAGFNLSFEDGAAVLNRPSEEKQDRALHGLYRALIANMTTGVSEGYTLTMEMIGVGYRAEVKGQLIEFALGYSHSVFFMLPPEVKATVEVVKGAAPKLILNSIDKQLIGQVAAKIRKLRAPEPYKGKGIRFFGEQVRRKAGKSAGKGKK